MARKPIIEQRDWWPEAVRQLEGLAAAGETYNAASVIVGREFGVSVSAITCAMDRGSVPAYPSRDPGRARAWANGETRYEGKPCKTHGTIMRFSNDGRCVVCMMEYVEKFNEKLKAADEARK